MLLAALCTGADPAEFAASIDDRGACGTVKAVVVEAVNERLRPHRRRRTELVTNPDFLDEVLARGALVPTRSQTRSSIASSKPWGGRTYILSRVSAAGHDVRVLANNPEEPNP